MRPDRASASAWRDGCGAVAEGDVARRVTLGGAARALSYGLTSLVTAVGSIFLLRHLGLVDFGRYGTVMALLAIVAGVTEGGLNTTATRDMSLLQGSARRDLLRDLVALRLVLSAAGVAGAVVFALLAGYDRELVVGTAVAGAGVLMLSLQASLLVPLIVELRNGRVSVSEVVRQGLLVAGIIGLSLAGAGLGSFFVNQLVAGALLLALTPWLLGRDLVVAPRFDWARSRELLRVAAPLALATVLGTLYFRILVVITSLVSDERETALFVTSTRVVELLVGIPLLLTGVVLPVLSVAARDDRGRLLYVTQRLTEVAALAGVAMFLVLLVGAEPLLVLLGGEEYRPVAPILRIQSPMIITLFLVSAWNPTLISLHRQKALLVVAALGLGSVVALGFALVPALDAEGAAIAASLAELVNAVAAYVALRRFGPGRELSAAWVPRLLLATGLAVGAALALPAPDAARTLVALAVFGGLATAFGLVPPEVRDALRRRPAAGSY